LQLPHKFAALDGLRGIAALVVAERHAAGWFDGTVLSGGYLAVDFFFILSGFVLAYAYDERLRNGMPAVDFLRGRVIRLYPLYLLALGLMLALMFYRAGNLRPTTVGYSLLLLPDFPSGHYWLIYPCWSLFFELVANAIFVVLHPVLKMRVLVGLCLAGLGLLVHCAFTFGHLNVGVAFPQMIDGLGRVLFGFFLGVILYRLRLSLPAARSLSWPLCLLSMLFLAISVPKDVRPWIDLGIVVFALPAIVLVASSAEPSRRSTTMLLALGAMSYGLYVLHQPVIEVASFVADRNGISALEGAFILITLAALTWLLDAIYDQPIRRWLGNVMLRRHCQSKLA